MVELVDGVGHVLLAVGAEGGAVGQIPGELEAQIVLVAAVLQQGVRVGLIVGEGEGVRQIVGQLP